MITTRPPSGGRARAPKWWGKFGEKLPKFSLPFLRPKTWTKQLAYKWINAIPDKCPFERQLWLRETLVLYIPPLCPLNPFSQQLYSIKLEAKTYLYDLEK
tara:strand:+ start:11654 stop:11953 length:300 start_codon:yes stop_codon:yes gene_type:complete